MKFPGKFLKSWFVVEKTLYHHGQKDLLEIKLQDLEYGDRGIYSAKYDDETYMLRTWCSFGTFHWNFGLRRGNFPIKVRLKILDLGNETQQLDFTTKVRPDIISSGRNLGRIRIRKS